MKKDSPDAEPVQEATGHVAPKETENKSREKSGNFGASVGQTLREAREKTGQSLRDVSGVLCIRHVYLDAIEQGNFAALPGDAYAYGFIRTYCDHLDLDQNEIVRRFKKEAEHYGKKKSLSFPHPVSEGKIPGFAVFFIAGLLMVLAYGGWFAWQSSLFDFSGVVSLSESEPEPGSDQRPAVVTPPDNLGEDAREGDLIISSREDNFDLVQSDNTPPPNSVSEPVPEPVGNGADGETASFVAPAQEEEAKEESQDSASNPEPVSLPDSEFSPQAVQPGQHFGAVVSRVVLRAQVDSWVQVDTAEGEILFGRVLRAGDSYGAPWRDGLTMKIGNAGGLVIAIDDQDQPTLGKQGEVVSGVPLAPLALQRFIAARNGN